MRRPTRSVRSRFVHRALLATAVGLTLPAAVAADPAGVLEPVLTEPFPATESTSPVAAGALSITGIPVPQMATCDSLIGSFMTNRGIPGATVAISKNGRLVYLRAFGTADVAGLEPTQPYHLFRVASVSKPVTSIAVMKAIENGLLDLDDRVFGPGGLLEDNAYFQDADITDTRIYDIRVRHLLDHSGGWNRGIDCFPDPTSPYPWFFGGCDPIVAPLHVTETLSEPNPVSERALIRFLMEKGLNFTPGAGYAYSNIGYLVAGAILEKLSGLSYEDHVQTTVLDPLGICDMHIGRNLRADKLEREGEYVGNGYLTYSLYETGTLVPWEYGGFSVEAMDAHGGWIATARDLTRLLVAVDGFATKPDILDSSSIATMTSSSPNNAGYALGWSVNTANNWWHFGGLDGTASFVARTWHGYTWAIILNKREGGNFYGALDNLPWNCLATTSSYPTHDLMAVPTVNTAGLTFTEITQDAVTVSWTPGDGDERILIASAGPPFAAYPLDGTGYTGSTVFGQGNALPDGSSVLYVGSGSSVRITGLSPSTPYRFRAYELNRNATTGDHPLYMLCDAEEAGLALAVAPGTVPSTLALDKSTTTAGDLTLRWDASCSSGATGYGIYEGPLSAWSDHVAIDCISGGGSASAEISPAAGSRYYLVVPHNANNEGSYGVDSTGTEREPGLDANRCRLAQELTSCN